VLGEYDSFPVPRSLRIFVFRPVVISRDPRASTFWLLACVPVFPIRSTGLSLDGRWLYPFISPAWSAPRFTSLFNFEVLATLLFILR